MTASAQTLQVDKLQQSTRPNSWVRNRKGDVVGTAFKIPKGDFAHFLGWKPESAEERAGEKKVSGARALEIAIQKQVRGLGEQAAKNGEMYRNMYIAWGKMSNEPGRTKDMLNSGMDSIRESIDLGHAMGMRYLEMQYKFQMASKNFGAISNLMRTRHESVKKSINEVR